MSWRRRPPSKWPPEAGALVDAGGLQSRFLKPPPQDVTPAGIPMKRLLSLLLIPLLACLVGFTQVGDLSKDDMRLTGVSNQILLVEITKVTLTDEKVVDGIGARDTKVEGKVLEVIRGKQDSKEFTSSWDIWRVVDDQAPMEKHGELAMDALRGGSNKTGIEDCKEGKRYVVITLAIEPHFVVFYEVPKDKDDWRKQIRPHEDPFKSTPPKTEPKKK